MEEILFAEKKTKAEYYMRYHSVAQTQPIRETDYPVDDRFSGLVSGLGWTDRVFHHPCSICHLHFRPYLTSISQNFVAKLPFPKDVKFCEFVNWRVIVTRVIFFFVGTSLTFFLSFFVSWTWNSVDW
jgi:hypothetical protein